MTEVKGNGLDDDCNPATPDSSWGAAAPAQASPRGDSSQQVSNWVNYGAAFALSLGTVLSMRIAWGRARRRR